MGITFLGVLLLAVGVGIGIGAWIAPTPPTTAAKSLVEKSITAAEASGAFHYAELSTESGKPFSIIGDATPDGGRQVITQIGASGTDVYDLRLVSGTVYFRGTKRALLDQIGVSTTQATSLAGKWIAVRKGAPVYKKFEEGITVSSNLSQIPNTFVAKRSVPVTGSKPAATRIVGGLFSGKGKPAVGSAAMVVTTSDSLPRTLTGKLTGGTARLTLTWTFSHFSEKVQVSAPSGAVSFGSLHAHAPRTTKTTRG